MNPIGRIALLWLLIGALLSGCVTQTEGRFSRQSSPEEALQAYTRLGMAYLQKGDFKLARRPLVRALEIDPEAPQANHGMALLYQHEGEYQLAEQHFSTAIRQGGTVTQARNNYAALLYELGRYQQACEQLERGVENTLYPGRARLFENLGRCYRKLQQDAKAIAAFKRALRLNRQSARALLELADLAVAREAFAEGQDYLQRYDTVASSTPRRLWLGILIARSQGDRAQVRSYAELLARRFPESAEYQLYKDLKTP